MRLGCLACVLLLAATVSGLRNPVLAAGGRFAFVLGNASYASFGPLPNPANDARAIAQALAGLNFEVDLQLDLTREALIGALPRVAARARDADLVTFFYAGHGLAISNQNYIVPIDARMPDNQTDVVEQMVALARVMEALEGAAKATLIILDSCRNNPYNDDASGTTRGARLGITRGLAELSGAAARNTGRGLARMDTGGAGMFVAFATKPGEFAYDSPGAGAANSPFTAALVRHVPTPGASLEAVMIRVRREVQEATSRRQLPWSQSSLVDDEVYLASRPQLSDASVVQQQRYLQDIDAKRRAEERATVGLPPPVPPTSAPTVAAPVAPPSPQAPSEQTAVLVPPRANWDGRWMGQSGGWRIEADVENGHLAANLTCRGSASFVFRLKADLRKSRKIESGAHRISVGTYLPTGSIDVAGTFPELTVLTIIGAGPGFGRSSCDIETMTLQPATKG